MTKETPALRAIPGEGSNFRFYDNRQKYLMFVNTCSEKWVIAQRVAKELETLSPEPPALRFFDAGVGDGTVLALTNMPYADAPWLRPADPQAKVAWLEVALKGSTTAEFERQILELQPFLDANWKTRLSPATGRLLPETPAVVVLYREDCRFILDEVIPRQREAAADFDLILASQPFRLRADVGFKARRVLAPLARALRPGGRMLGIHSAGNDPGLEIVQRVWPGEDPFVTSRRDLLDATRAALGEDAGQFTFDPLPNSRALFRYEMHTLPEEIDATIGTSTLLAAWNAATYVAQIDDERLAEAMSSSAYLDATRAVLRKHGELWFNDESYLITRTG